MKIARRPMKADVPSTAMGDIAFNLLIFFVILARAQDDGHVKWQPAEAANVEQAGNTKVSVVIDTEGLLYLNGQPVGEMQLASRIQGLLGEAGVGNRIVFLKVNKDAPAQKFEPVIEAISEAGGELVHILDKKR